MTIAIANEDDDDGIHLLEPLGAGTHATVFRARRRDGTIVAAKRVPVIDADAVARLRREAMALQRIPHPHVLPCLDLVERDGDVLLLLALADGSLADRIAASGPLPPPDVAAIGAALAGALAAAHDRGVLHRDVKPHNVLWLDGEPRLGDFGTALVQTAAPLTAAGTALGSAPYLDPRIADGGVPDEAADVYALGVVLHEALTGQPPFVATTPLATIEAARQGPYRRPTVPGATHLVDAIAAAIGDVARRPTAAALAELLARAEPALAQPAASPSPAPPDVAWARPRPLRRRQDALHDTRRFGTPPPRRRIALDEHRRAAAIAGIASIISATAAAAASLHALG